MEEINLDIDNDLKNMDFSLNNSEKPQKINIIKNDSSSSMPNIEQPVSKPNLSISPSKESNIGLDLLVNKKKKSSSDSPNVFSSNTLTTTTKPQEISSSSDFSNLDILDIGETKPKDNSNSGLNTLDDILSDINIDEPKGSTNFSDNSNPMNLDDNDIFSTLDDTNDIFSSQPTSAPSPVEIPQKEKTFEDLQKDKFELLCNLERLEEKGARLHKKFSMQSDYNEMKYEYDRVTKQRETSQSIKFQRKMLVACVTAIEFLNNKFDPFDIKLDGWSESIHENSNDYDDVFEELHEKYKQKAHIAPELKLLLMLGGSGFMFHLTNTMFKSSLPGMGDIMKQNPELMQQFAKAAVNTMGNEDSGFGNLMGDMVDMNQSKQQSYSPRTNQQTNKSNIQQRKEMKGPPDLDQILDQLSDTNINNINLDSASDMSDSDLDIKNIDIGMSKRSRNKNRKGINLDI
jgi:hypothetical protein